MPPRLTASYRVKELTFELVILPLFSSGFLDQDIDGLVEKHRQYLDMIQWEENAPSPLVIAKGCARCPGVLDKDGDHSTRPARMYVDDALLAATGRAWMEKKLAATIEAIFCVMGYPDESSRRCPLSLDKWNYDIWHCMIMNNRCLCYHIHKRMVHHMTNNRFLLVGNIYAFLYVSHFHHVFVCTIYPFYHYKLNSQFHSNTISK